jgi:disulfide bond formation protein DsbB
MDDVDFANRFFTVLTIAANAAVVALVACAVLARPVPAVARLRDRVVAAVGPQAVPLALLVAAVTTAGSLYYSEGAGFTPCELCWYQRICMYPLVAILAVGALRRDRDVRWYAAPLIVVGAPISLYHWLVERVDALSDSVSCSATAPCSVPYFEELGYVTLAFMALSAFLLIGALLILGRAYDHAEPETEKPETEKPETEKPETEKMETP